MSRRPVRGRRRRIGVGWQWGAWALLAAALAIGVVVGILDYGPRLFPGVPIAQGEKAPVFTLENSAGARVSVADYFGRKAVLLIFIPGYQ